MQSKQPSLKQSPVICQRCKKGFEPFTIDEIQGLSQLRCGSVIIPRAEMVCLHCGWIFHWNIREKDLSKMAVTYGVILQSIRAYAPE
jgi:hypothetical protein